MTIPKRSWRLKVHGSPAAAPVAAPVAAPSAAVRSLTLADFIGPATRRTTKRTTKRTNKPTAKPTASIEERVATANSEVTDIIPDLAEKSTGKPLGDHGCASLKDARPVSDGAGTPPMSPTRDHGSPQKTREVFRQ